METRHSFETSGNDHPTSHRHVFISSHHHIPDETKKKSRSAFSSTLFFPMALRPYPDQGLLIHEVSRSHTTTHHSRQDYSGQVINSSQRRLSDNTQQSQLTDNHVIRTPNLSRRVAADLSLRPRGHWDRLCLILEARVRSRVIFFTA
jgi:hypothetical protein